MRPYPNPVPFVAVALMLAAPIASAQEQADSVTLELNRIDPVEGEACRLTFLVENGLSADIEDLTLETVLIDAEGQVDRLTLFEFGTLPAGIPRVRQFDIGGLSCEALGRVLINDVSSCSGTPDCADALTFSTRTEVEVTG